jgi:hypothetical protein
MRGVLCDVANQAPSQCLLLCPRVCADFARRSFIFSAQVSRERKTMPPTRPAPKKRQKRCVEVPRQAHLDLTFRVGAKKKTLKQEVADASGLRTSDVKAALAAIRDTLVRNLGVRKYSHIPGMLRFRKTSQRKNKTSACIVDGKRCFQREPRVVRKTLVKCNVLKPLRVAFAA